MHMCITGRLQTIAIPLGYLFRIKEMLARCKYRRPYWGEISVALALRAAKTKVVCHLGLQIDYFTVDAARR